jgi:hypothetical protein
MADLVLVDPTLYDKTTATSGYQLLEDLLEVLGNLLKSPFDGFILTLVQDIHELCDRVCRVFKVRSSLNKLVSLLGEVVVLFESFLVHMRELLQAFIHRVQLLDKLITRVMSVFVHLERCKIYLIGMGILILFVGAVRQNTKITNVAITFIFSSHQNLPFRVVSFGQFLLLGDAAAIRRLFILGILEILAKLQKLGHRPVKLLFKICALVSRDT